STAWPLAAAIAGAAVLLCGLIGGRAAATAVSDRGESGRATSAATIAVTVLVLVAAGVSLWQFKLYGSPLVADSTGTPRVDPLTVLAPALTLLALATLGLLAFGPGARLLQALTVRRDSILPVLAGWQVARRVGIFGA